MYPGRNPKVSGQRKLSINKHQAGASLYLILHFELQTGKTAAEKEVILLLQIDNRDQLRLLSSSRILAARS